MMSRKMVEYFRIFCQIVLIVIVAIIAIVLLRAGLEKASHPNQMNEELFMRVIEEGELGSISGLSVHYRILVDRETGAMYYVEYSTKRRASGEAITPLYNADGTLKIYNGD